MNKVIGIDLGTNNSVAIVTEAGKVTVIINSQGSRATHLAVALTKAGERQLEQLAKLQAGLDSKDTGCREPILGRTAKRGFAIALTPK